MVDYDVVVIGAGPTGENVADRAVRGGLTAAVVESELVGGECSYWACMPSKALLRPPSVLAEARAVEGARQAVNGTLDVAAVLRRRDGFVSHWRDDGQVQWLDSTGIALHRGYGRLTGPREVAVTARDGTVTTLRARHAVVLATGSKPVLPDIPGLADADPWSSRDATSAQEVPKRLAVLGGGVVGVEMAFAWHELGSDVTMLVRGGRLLASMEPFAGERVAAGLTARNIDVRLGTGLSEVRRDAGSGVLTLTLDGGGTVEADELLVATGRRPATDEVGLETVGLDPAKPVTVDAFSGVQGVDGDWLYAIGDANGEALLTHMGKYQGRACGDTIAARARGENPPAIPWSPYTPTADRVAVTQVVFTHPEVAAVGLTEQAARDAGLPVRAVEYAIGDVAGAGLFADGYDGHAKIVVDTERRVIVGCTLVGPQVGEMLHAATVAVVGEVPLDRLWHAVPSYPTISELWLRLLETYGL
ncbi:MAG: dihydrolipoyl dehydrogenase family protein [Mycobacteriales bacterium]